MQYPVGFISQGLTNIPLKPCFSLFCVHKYRASTKSLYGPDVSNDFMLTSLLFVSIMQDRSCQCLGTCLWLFVGYSQCLVITFLIPISLNPQSPSNLIFGHRTSVVSRANHQASLSLYSPLFHFFFLAEQKCSNLSCLLIRTQLSCVPIFVSRENVPCSMFSLNNYQTVCNQNVRI